MLMSPHERGEALQRETRDTELDGSSPGRRRRRWGGAEFVGRGGVALCQPAAAF